MGKFFKKCVNTKICMNFDSFGKCDLFQDYKDEGLQKFDVIQGNLMRFELDSCRFI